jgi:hypothetical protein
MIHLELVFGNVSGLCLDSFFVCNLGLDSVNTSEKHPLSCFCQIFGHSDEKSNQV